MRNFSKYHRIEGGSVRPVEEGAPHTMRRNSPSDWIVADASHGVEPIISRELFDLAQAKRTERNSPFTRGKSLLAPYYLSGLAVCTCGHHLQGHTTQRGKNERQQRYFYYTCGGFRMKGKTVCKHYLLARERLEQPVLRALAARLRAMGQADRLQALIAEELRAQQGDVGDSIESLQGRIREVHMRTRQWEEAIEKGLDVAMAVGKINALLKEKSALESRLHAAKTAQHAPVDVEAVAESILKSLDALEQVLAQGSVAEVKALLRAYIGRIEVDPQNGKARIGFLKLPIRALLSASAPESARISMVAGVGFEPTL